MPPTLLIFIVGPGGSRPLEGGWQARLRTLCPSGAVFFSHSPPSNTWARDPEARGCGRTVWALRNGRALVPRGPTGRVPRDPCANKQGLVSREKDDICRVGQRRLNSQKGVQPERREEKACRSPLTARNGSTPSTCLRVLCWLPGGQGRPALPSGAAWLSW